MKLTFSTFRQLNEGSDFSIPHLEDLELETFMRLVRGLHKLGAVQKLDGANLRGGLDEKGALYTSREQKGGRRFYKEGDFPKHSAYDGFKSAHLALKKVEDKVKGVLEPGEAFNMEVIFGAQPNTVFYGLDGYSYVAFLEMLPGDDPSHDPDQGKVKRLVQALADEVVTVETMASDTIDGITLARAPRLTDWKFVGQPRLSTEEVDAVGVEDEVAELEALLAKTNDVARQLGQDVTNLEVLKDRSGKLRDERKRLEDKITRDVKLPIKEKLLGLVRKQQPALRSPTTAKDGTYLGIEGIIFTDPKSREKFKVVDREVFTRVNQFNYQVRKSVAGRVTSADPNLPIEARGGLVGNARVRAVKLFGLEGAELPSQAKRVIEKLKGASRDETVKNLSDSLHQLPFEAVRRKLQAVYISTIDDLEDALDTFKQHADEYELKLDDGAVVKYTKEVKRRTLMTFAEARKDLTATLVQVRDARYLEDLLEVFFKKQLDALHGAPKSERQVAEAQSAWEDQDERLSAAPVKAEYLKHRGKHVKLGNLDVLVSSWERENKSGSWASGFKWMNTTYGTLTRRDPKTGRRTISLNHGKTWHDTVEEAGRRSSGKVILQREGTKEAAYDEIQRANQRWGY